MIIYHVNAFFIRKHQHKVRTYYVEERDHFIRLLGSLFSFALRIYLLLQIYLYIIGLRIQNIDNNINDNIDRLDVS